MYFSSYSFDEKWSFMYINLHFLKFLKITRELIKIIAIIVYL